MSDIIDINVNPTVEEVTIDVQPNVTVVNVNTIQGIPEAPIDGEIYGRQDASWEIIPPVDVSALVPYTGATTDVDLGENGISTGFVKFDTTPTDIPELQGAMFWDEDDNTVDVILNGYRMKIGEDTFYPVKNQSGSTITKGTNVKFAGTVGASGRLLILPFLANGTDPSYVYMGVTAEDILDGEDGKVLWFGRLRGLNTNAFNEGDVLYASTTSAGGFQNTIPTGANNIVQVSAVIKKSTNQGVIFIRPQIEPVLFKPENVANKSINLTSPDNVKYPTTLAVSTALSGKQDTLTNPVTGTGANGQVSFWNGTNSQSGDNGLFWNNTNKRLGIGTNAPNSPIEINSNLSGLQSAIATFTQYSTDAGTTGGFIGRKSRGTTSSPSQVLLGDTLAGFFASGYHSGGAFGVNSVSLRFNAAENFTPNAQGTLIQLATTPTGSTTRDTRLQINSNGNVLIQNGGTFTDAGFRLDVNGTARFSGDIRTQNGTTYTDLTANASTGRVISALIPATFLLNVYMNRTSIYGGTGVHLSGANLDSGTITNYTNLNIADLFSRAVNTRNLSIRDFGGTATDNKSFTIATSGAALNQAFQLFNDAGGFGNIATFGISSKAGHSIRDFDFRMNSADLDGGTLIYRAFGVSTNFGFGSATDIASAAVHITSTTKGFLPPRMTNAQRLAIASPAVGLIVYDTTLLALFQYNGTTWINVNSNLPLQVTPITLLSSGWTLVSGLYEYVYSNANILSTSVVDVIPSNSTIAIVKAADVLPQTDSSAGSVKLYATNLPSADIVVTFNIIN